MPEGERDRGGVAIFGRERELAFIENFVAATPPPATLVLTGGAGMGKTTLWEAGVQAARKRGLRVLSARPTGAEARLSFSALTDLLEVVETTALAGLPSPQLRALEVALMRADPGDTPPEPRAIALGLLNTLRALGTRAGVLIALDDVEWLDLASADALVYAARRLSGDGVRFLLTRRSETPSALEQALEHEGLACLEVGRLSLGATRRLLSARLGVSPPRRVLRQIVGAARGNPLLALELGRTFAQYGPPPIGEEIPVPAAVEELLGTRVVGLPRPVQRVLLALALSADLRVAQLAAVVGGQAVEDAAEAGSVLLDADRVRPAHPLLATAAKGHASARERRALHLELAGAVADEGLRARHLALATDRPDAGLAGTLTAAAEAASAHGAVEEAVELAEHALRLTPSMDESRSDRLLALAEYLGVAGEPQRVRDLLVAELETLPGGKAVCRAHLLLADISASTMEEFNGHLERALAASANDPALRAAALARKAEHACIGSAERISAAEAWALEALLLARGADPEVERFVRYALGWARILRGREAQEESGLPSWEETADLVDSLARVESVRLTWRGRVDEARTSLLRLRELADDRGEMVAYTIFGLHLAELELRAGGWDAVSRVLGEWGETPEEELVAAPCVERCRALLAAGRGLPEEAERWAAEAIAKSEETGVRWDGLEALRARGIAALLVHEPRRAAETLSEVWEHARREGVDDPGAFPVGPDLAEALLDAGERERAIRVADRLSALAEEQEHPWGLAAARRCRALVALASGADDRDAAVRLEEVAVEYDRLGLRFDRARTLLAVGRAMRRRRKWAAARRFLEQAALAFDGLGSEGWAAEARSELARVGARRPQGSRELTPAERRVTELAAEGLANKEIARSLFVSVHTVEVHLSHAYAKLGVRSRAELARHPSYR